MVRGASERRWNDIFRRGRFFGVAKNDRGQGRRRGKQRRLNREGNSLNRCVCRWRTRSGGRGERGEGAKSARPGGVIKGARAYIIQDGRVAIIAPMGDGHYFFFCFSFTSPSIGCCHASFLSCRCLGQQEPLATRPLPLSTLSLFSKV